MSLISQLLAPENIVLDFDASSKKRVFERAGLLFENNQGIASSAVFDSLFAREKLGSTGLAAASRFRTAASRTCSKPAAPFFA